MNLSDIDHYVGGDLSASSTGDLLTASGTTRSQQRILRRLLTNPGEYIFHRDYGAGLPKYIGTNADIPKIKALIRGQILLEDSVAKSPAPVINVTQLVLGGISVSIQYVDSLGGIPATLNFNVGT